MNLPPELTRLLAGRALEPITIGESGAAVWRCTQTELATWYFKTAPINAGLALEREAARMRWMRDAGMPAPAVLDYRQQLETEFLLTESAIGIPVSDNKWHDAGAQIATALGIGLARLHSTDITTCPFDRRIAVQLDEARARIAAGQVCEDDFDESRLGRNVGELFTDLLNIVPTREDLVFVHGDFCLPNILLTPNGEALDMTGLIDCGRAGIGDRHQDLALAIRSLTYNFGDELTAPFLKAYGCPEPDARAIEFFTILDEFF